MKVKCEVCGEEIDSARRRPSGDYCYICGGWLPQLGKGPRQDNWLMPEDKGRSPEELHPVYYEKLGMVISYLVRSGKLREEDFVHGLIKGMRR